MPYEIKGKCVHNKETGKNMGCSDTIEKAKAHMKALYANVEDDEKSLKTESTSPKFLEKTNISKFIECVLKKNYSDAHKYLNAAVDTKLQAMIQQELDTPLF